MNLTVGPTFKEAWELWEHQIINIKYVYTLCQGTAFVVIFPKEAHVSNELSSRTLLQHHLFKKKMKQPNRENLYARKTVWYNAYVYS